MTFEYSLVIAMGKQNENSRNQLTRITVNVFLTQIQ